MRKILSILMSLVALSFMASCSSDTPSETSQAESIGSEAATTPDSGSSAQPTMPNETAYDGVFPQHEPYGTGIGAMPGRVVWTHDPDSVEWDGEGYWWELAHFDEERIIQMVERGIASLADEEDAVSGWERLFTSHNTSRGRQGDYQPGQKIAIKTNMNGSGAYGDDQHGETRESYTNPVLLRALLLSLIEDAGVSPSDITVYDAGRIFPDWMRELCGTGALEGVQFRYRDVGGSNDASADTNAPVLWS